ncbi:MAG: thioredoxin [Clostridiales bacterium]|jgi:thioredoxin 1|nr:thioredoxin [Clostridiales bacterium]
MASKNVIELTVDSFDSEVLNSEQPVLVDFWAAWCGPCRMIAPIIDQLADEYEGKLKVGKVNVDEQGQLAAQYGVMSIPTLIFFKNGEAVERLVGVRPKPELDRIIQKVL